MHRFPVGQIKLSAILLCLVAVLGVPCMIGAGRVFSLPPYGSDSAQTGPGEGHGRDRVATIVAAIIGACGTIGAAIIGRKSGRKEGLTEGLRQGGRHSVLRFLDVQEEQLEKAEDAIRRRDYAQLEAIAAAIVDNARTWRKIQENFRELLNGRIEDIGGILRSGNPAMLEGSIRALKEGFKGKRLAVETELEKSKI